MTTWKIAALGTGLAFAMIAACSSDEENPAKGRTGGGTGGSGPVVTDGGSGGATGDSGGGTGGTTGDAAPATCDGVLLSLEAEGEMVADNAAGVKGSWYKYGDSLGSSGAAPGDCQKNGFTEAQCSKITSFTASGSKICTSGTAAKVADLADGGKAYSAIWGSGVALDLNNPSGTVAAYDATAYKGLCFTISGTKVPAELRVEVPFTGTETCAYIYKVSAAGSYTATFASGLNSFGQPSWCPPTPFDATKLLSVQFHVATNDKSEVPYDFCVENLTLIK